MFFAGLGIGAIVGCVLGVIAISLCMAGNTDDE